MQICRRCITANVVSNILYPLVYVLPNVDEAQRLRDLLRSREEEVRDFESSAQAHQADEEKVRIIHEFG